MLTTIERRAGLMLCGALVLILTLAGTAPAQFGGPSAPTRKTVTTFASNGQNIRLWTFEPAKAGKYPLVVMLHGIEGLEGLDKFAAQYDMVARRLAAKGYVVYFVHYFDRTCHIHEDIKILETNIKTMLVSGANAPNGEKVRSLFKQWMGTVADGIKFGRTQPHVAPDRVALVGFSLGGFVALGTAATEPKLGVDAIVEFFGGLPRELHLKLDKMPPVLIFHGDKDSIVPVKEAYDLQAALKAKKNLVEDKIYGCGHMFGGDNNQFRFDLAMDAEARTVAFLAKQLGKKK